MSLFTVRDEEYDLFRKDVEWELRFFLWPRKCYYSNQWIWLKTGYRGTRMITGPGDPVFLHRWLTKEEFLMGILKGKI
jgi:hypothetical protein